MTQPPEYAVTVPSNAGIHNEPAKSYQWQQMSEDQLRVTRKKMQDQIMQLVVLAFTGIYIPTTSGNTQLQQWANDRVTEFNALLLGLWTAFTGLFDSALTPEQVAAAAAANTEMLSAMAKSVSTLRQELIATQQAAGGNAIAMADDPFDGSGAMSVNWEVRKLIPFGGGEIVRNGGQLVWDEFGGLDQEILCRWRGPNPVSLTDNQRVSIVLGAPLVTPAVTLASDNIVLRCNAAKTTYVKVKFQSVNFKVIAVNNNVETLIHTEPIDLQAVGTVARVDAGTALGPRWFTVKLGTKIYSINDSGNVSQYGSAFRGWGLGMYAQSFLLLSQIVPGAIDYWQASDNPDMLLPPGGDATGNYVGGDAPAPGAGFVTGGSAFDPGAGIISGGHA